MRTRTLTAACVVATILASSDIARGSDGAAAIAVDAVVVRPVLFGLTVAGAVFFVLALPFAGSKENIRKAADNLVVLPAKATFARPIGDFEDLPGED